MTSLFQGSDKTRLSIYVAAGVGVITISGLIYIYRRYRDNYIPPKEWKKVGELTDLICYPIKSCGPVRVSSIHCSKIGLESNLMRDRIFMVVRTDGEFITGRQHPKMILVQPSFHDKIMKLSAPGMIDVEIDVERLKKLSPITTRVWNQPVKTVDCGEEVARWFSRYILAEDFGLRLMYYPHDCATREVKPANRMFSTMSREDTGALHDATSFMLLNESSIADLNTRLENPVSILNFRPNFLVKGPAEFEEDHWKWVKIGDEVIFRSNKPCTRCIFTNIDPETAKRSPDGNPLKTLKGYRQFAKIGTSPVIGLHLGLRKIFMVVRTDGEFITGRQHPKMILVQPSFHDKIMKLSAPGMIDVEIDVERLKKLSPITTRVWNQPVKTVDCGEEVARWFSRYILAEDFGLRLMYYPHDCATREVKPANRMFSTMSREDTGALHDATSFMLLNESSIADLNTRLENPVSILNFRPNFLVKGPAEFEEDHWKWVKIGDEVIFRSNKPCTRCIFTNIDPETAKRSPDGNPLKTLKGYRQFAKIGTSPVIGLHLGLRKSGKINLGDLVYVGF